MSRKRSILTLPFIHLVSVAIGCSLVGTSIGLIDVFTRGSPLGMAAYYAVMAVIIGIVPGALLALPGMLVGMWLRQRTGQLDIVWVWLLGLANGLIVFLPVFVAYNASNPTNVSFELGVVFLVAGGVAAVVFSKLDHVLQ